MTAYLCNCLYCGFLTKHPSHTCAAHRDLAPPIEGLDEPYDEGDQLALDLPEPDRVESHPDAYRA